MLSQFFSLGLLMLFSVMLPGPDFAMVTKNTLMHSRRAGIFTTLGIALAVSFHISYCLLGVALLISQSLLLFNVIKYIGAAYLIYLGISSLRSKQSGRILPSEPNAKSKTDLSAWQALRQGFFCNLLNPKATLFFLALFTVVIKPETPRVWVFTYAGEMLAICILWFISLTFILSHPRVARRLEMAEKYINKILGVFLIGFGVALIFVSSH